MSKKRKTNPKPSRSLPEIPGPIPDPPLVSQQQSQSKKRCGKCDYFDQFKIQDPDHSGKCRRHAPTIIADNVPYPAPTNVRTVFPEVNVDDWCGEHSDGRSSPSNVFAGNPSLN